MPPACVYRERTCSIYREHILCTILSPSLMPPVCVYIERTCSIHREHILCTILSPSLMPPVCVCVYIYIHKEHILSIENTFLYHLLCVQHHHQPGQLQLLPCVSACGCGCVCESECVCVCVILDSFSKYNTLLQGNVNTIHADK